MLPAFAVTTSSAFFISYAGGRGDRNIPGVPAAFQIALMERENAERCLKSGELGFACRRPEPRGQHDREKQSRKLANDKNRRARRRYTRERIG